MGDNTKQLEELFEVKAHLGHKTNRVHPKAKKNIYTVENGVSIIDLTKTASLLKTAVDFMSDLAKENKQILIVSTKKIASEKVQAMCQEHTIPYVTTKWPAGLITNFETITKNVKKLIQMKKDKAEGAWTKFVKHDRTKLEKEMLKLEKYYGGLITLEKLPDALFVVDVKKEKNAVNEATKSHILIAAIADTNVDPESVNFPIPANDDSLSSIEYIVGRIIDAYVRHKKTEKTS